MTSFTRAVVVASLLAGSTAAAQPKQPAPTPRQQEQAPQAPTPQPAPQPPQPPVDPSKLDAKALMQTGVKLLELKDYLGALAIFKDAYARFASARILLNIGTTLKLLDRKAEAANTYQRYLDSPDADNARKTQVLVELVELDKSLGIVQLTVTPTDAEVRLPGDDWLPAERAKLWRLTPGAFTIDARKTGYLNGAVSGTVAAGAKTQLSLVLNELPKQTLDLGDTDLIKQTEPEKPRSRIGALAMLHVSVTPKLGSAALIGATADVTPQLGVDGAVLLGPGLVSEGMATRPPPKLGGYVGAHFSFLPGRVRPRAGAGMTIFGSNGARFQVRGAGGIEYVANRNISLTLELGAEVALNPEDDIRTIAIVPSLAVAGRL
jgi:hypothetical protein